MREPVIASIGMVETEIPANRARFDASFNAVGRSADAALAEAAAKVRAIDAELRKAGADRVRIATTFDTQPLYEQYRDKDGNLQTNMRPDKIERYSVTAGLEIEVRDLAALETAYAAVVAGKPTSIGTVSFRLEPDNATRTWLQTEAVKDAARRGRQAVEAAGARLGAVKVIDPTARACRTDVLAGWPGYARAPEQRTQVAYDEASAISVTAQRSLAAPAPPPPAAPPAVTVSLQPPQTKLTDDACIVYGLL
jgi:uncharacterized protein YggE